MTGLARLLLVLTCLAPIAFVQAGVEFERGHYEAATLLVALVAFLVLLCIALIEGVKRYTAPVPKSVRDPDSKSSEALAFLVSYALPLVAAKQGEGSVFGLVAFACVTGLVLLQLQVFHVNPLLAAFGYKFFEVKSGGARALVISREHTLASGDLPVVRISDYVWLHRRDAGGGGHESSIDDPKRRDGPRGQA